MYSGACALAFMRGGLLFLWCMCTYLWVSTSGGGGYYYLLRKGQLVCPTKHQHSKKAGGEIRDSAVKPSGEQATEVKGRLAKGRVQFEAP